MKCHLFIFSLLLISLVVSNDSKNATTRKKGVVPRNIKFSTKDINHNAGKLKNLTGHRPEVKSKNITITKDKRHKTTTALNPNGKIAQSSKLDRKYINNNKGRNFTAEKSTVGKRNIAISKSNDTKSHTTTVEARNITTARIEYKLLKKPHNLFIGRCYPKKYPVLHQENVIVTNDEKSHVTAKIKMIVAGPVYITCANIYDQGAEGEESYPTYSSGGVGRNFVEFDVLTQYGKGFKVFVQIFGYRKDKVVQENKTEQNDTALRNR